MSRNPLFDVMFVLQNNEEAKEDLKDILLKPLEIEGNIAKFDLTIAMNSNRNGYGVSFEYCSDLFKEETIGNMIKHFEVLLANILESPEKKIKDIEIITEEEKEKILKEFNNTTADYPRNKTIQELFEEQVEKTPNNIAVVFEDKEITYEELNRKANQLARYLREEGVKPNDYVGIMVERSIEMIIGIYGIIKAGGAYVPIDPSYPEERIEYMLEDCRAKILLTGGEDINISKKVKENLKVVDLFNKEYYKGLESNLGKVNSPEDSVYLIYTSGTTGKPKGVMVGHKGIVNLREFFIRTYSISDKDVILQFANYIFDASVYEMTAALLTGASLCMISQRIH